MKAQTLIDQFEYWAPTSIAEEGDPVGLQLGNPDRDIHRVMTTLDVRPEVVAEAIDRQVDFIFAHHPMMFRPARNLDTRDPQNRMYAALLAHDIVVYGAHTNLDNVAGGMNDWLADELQLTNTEPLLAGGVHPMTHEYYGMGRVGDLPREMTLAEFTQFCLDQFQIPGVRVVAPDQPRLIRRVAVLGGSGGQFYLDAVNHRADAYVTGDISYHTGHDIKAHDLIAIDPGHHVESVCKAQLRTIFTDWATKLNWRIDVIASELSTEPFKFQMR